MQVVHNLAVALNSFREIAGANTNANVNAIANFLWIASVFSLFCSSYSIEYDFYDDLTVFNIFNIWVSIDIFYDTYSNQLVIWWFVYSAVCLVLFARDKGTLFCSKKKSNDFFIRNICFSSHVKTCFVIWAIVNSISSVIFYHFSLKNVAQIVKNSKKHQYSIELTACGCPACLVNTQAHDSWNDLYWIAHMLIQQNCVHCSCSCHCQLWGCSVAMWIFDFFNIYFDQIGYLFLAP